MALGTPVNAVFASSTETSSLTTGSFTPADDSLLIIFASGQSDDGDAPTISDSEGLTWTRQANAEQSAYQDVGAVWTTPITTGASMTVTIATTSNLSNVHVRGVTVTGYDTTTPVGGAAAAMASGMTGSQSLTMPSTSESNSLVIGMARGRDGAATDIDTGASWTQLDEDVANSAVSQIQYRVAAVSSIPWAEVVATGYGAGALLGIEIQEAAATGTTVAAAVDALVLTEQQATITVDHNIAATTDALVLAELAATITVANDTNIAAATDALTLATLAATVSVDHEISATTEIGRASCRERV